MLPCRKPQLISECGLNYQNKGQRSRVSVSNALGFGMAGREMGFLKRASTVPFIKKTTENVKYEPRPSVAR